MISGDKFIRWADVDDLKSCVWSVCRSVIDLTKIFPAFVTIYLKKSDKTKRLATPRFRAKFQAAWPRTQAIHLTTRRKGRPLNHKFVPKMWPTAYHEMFTLGGICDLFQLPIQVLKGNKQRIVFSILRQKFKMVDLWLLDRVNRAFSYLGNKQHLVSSVFVVVADF